MPDLSRIALRLILVLGEVACWLALLFLGRDLLIEHWMAAISVFLGYGIFIFVGLMCAQAFMDWRPVTGGFIALAISLTPAAPFLLYGALTLGWPVGLFGLAGLGNFIFSFTKHEV